MKVNFDTEFHTFEGEPFYDVVPYQETLSKAAGLVQKHGNPQLANQLLQLANEPKDQDVPLTLKTVCLRSLAAGVQTDQDPNKAVEQFELGEKIRVGGEVEISTEQASLLKGVIVRAYKSVMISGQACKVLNG